MKEGVCHCEFVSDDRRSCGMIVGVVLTFVVGCFGLYLYHVHNCNHGGNGVAVLGPMLVHVIDYITARRPVSFDSKPSPKPPLTPPASPPSKLRIVPEPAPSWKDNDGPQAWVTLATNDEYAKGALVVGASLSKMKTTRKTHCMITHGVSDKYKLALGRIFTHVSTVDQLDSDDTEHLKILGRPELGITWTKLKCWKLVQYCKCVFVDADTCFMRNADELFEHDELSAVPDVGWPDVFNSGVFVFVPSLQTYKALLRCAIMYGSFDGGDQGLLNTYFPNWHRVSFIFNCTSSASYSYLAAYLRFNANIRLVHFLGSDKPWHQNYAPDTGEINPGTSAQTIEHVKFWWQVWHTRVAPIIDPDPRVHESTIVDEHQREWESGAPDVQGRDSFENIQKRIADSIAKNKP